MISHENLPLHGISHWRVWLRDGISHKSERNQFPSTDHEHLMAGCQSCVHVSPHMGRRSALSLTIIVTDNYSFGACTWQVYVYIYICIYIYTIIQHVQHTCNAHLRIVYSYTIQYKYIHIYIYICIHIQTLVSRADYLDKWMYNNIMCICL